MFEVFTLIVNHINKWIEKKEWPYSLRTYMEAEWNEYSKSY